MAHSEMLLNALPGRTGKHIKDPNQDNRPSGQESMPVPLENKGKTQTEMLYSAYRNGLNLTGLKWGPVTTFCTTSVQHHSTMSDFF